MNIKQNIYLHLHKYTLQQPTDHRQGTFMPSAGVCTHHYNHSDDAARNRVRNHEPCPIVHPGPCITTTFRPVSSKEREGEDKEEKNERKETHHPASSTVSENQASKYSKPETDKASSSPIPVPLCITKTLPHRHGPVPPLPHQIHDKARQIIHRLGMHIVKEHNVRAPRRVV